MTKYLSSKARLCAAAPLVMAMLFGCSAEPSSNKEPGQVDSVGPVESGQLSNSDLSVVVVPTVDGGSAAAVVQNSGDLSGVQTQQVDGDTTAVEATVPGAESSSSPVIVQMQSAESDADETSSFDVAAALPVVETAEPDSSLEEESPSQSVVQASTQVPASAATEDTAGSSSTTIIVGNRPGDASCLRLPADASGLGSISRADWSDWLADVRFTVGTEHLELTGEVGGRRSLRQRFLPSGEGSPRVVVGAELPEAGVYRLVQSMYLEPGWDWGGDAHYQTGKFGFGFSGGTSPTGGTLDTGGFSARVIWRGNNDGTARMAIYSYAADRPGQYGEDVYFGEFEAPTGEWFDLAMEIQVNSSINAADGRMRGWINGQLLLDRDGVAWQTSGAKPSIDNLYYTAFYGGNSAEWSPDRTTHAQFRDVCWAAVVDGYSGIDPDTGRIVAPDSVQLDQQLFDDDSQTIDQDNPREEFNNSVEAVFTQLSSVLDNESPLVGHELRSAYLLLKQSTTEGNWVSDFELSIDAPTLLQLDSAAASLLDAIDALTLVGGSVSLLDSLASRVVKLSEELVERMVNQATNTFRLAECAELMSQSCSLASVTLTEALEAQQLMSWNRLGGDRRQILEFAVSGWQAATQAQSLAR